MKTPKENQREEKHSLAWEITTEMKKIIYRLIYANIIQSIVIIGLILFVIFK